MTATDANGLSLAAQLVVLAIDPRHGRLFDLDEKRLGRALVAVSAAPSGRRAYSEALDELQRAGLVERTGVTRRLRIVPRSGAGKALRRLRECIEKDDFADARDVELFLLLAWTGVLAHRLTRAERTVAARRLRALVATDAFGDWIGTLEAREQTRPASHTRSHEIPGWAQALGRVALRGEVDLAGELAADHGGASSGQDSSSGHGATTAMAAGASSGPSPNIPPETPGADHRLAASSVGAMAMPLHPPGVLAMRRRHPGFYGATLDSVRCPLV